MRTKQGERAVIISLVCAVIFCMGMGYSSIIKTLNTNQNKDYQMMVTNIDAKVENSSIAEVLSTEKNGSVANLKMSLNHVKDKVIYTIQVLNNGSIDAMVENINIEDKIMSGEARVPVSYVVEGLSKGAIIKSGMTATFTVTVTYESDSTLADNASVIKEAVVSLDCKAA